MLVGDKIAFVLYADKEKAVDNVVFTIYEKSTKQMIATINAEDLRNSYRFKPEEEQSAIDISYYKYIDKPAFIGIWKTLDVRKSDENSKLWYFVEASVDGKKVSKNKFRVRNPHIIEYKLLTEDRGNGHSRGFYYREYASVQIKGCDLDGISDFLRLEYTERDQTTDETFFCAMMIPNKGTKNIYKTPKFRFTTTNTEIDWLAKCKQTLDVMVYPQIYLRYEDAGTERLHRYENYIRRQNGCNIMLGHEAKLLNDFDENLSSSVGIGTINEEVPSFLFKDLNTFIELLKYIEKNGYTGYSVIIFNSGEFILQL